VGERPGTARTTPHGRAPTATTRWPANPPARTTQRPEAGDTTPAPGRSAVRRSARRPTPAHPSRTCPAGAASVPARRSPTGTFFTQPWPYWVDVSPAASHDRDKEKGGLRWLIRHSSGKT
jgi:hypothetical protein